MFGGSEPLTSKRTLLLTKMHMIMVRLLLLRNLDFKMISSWFLIMEKLELEQLNPLHKNSKYYLILDPLISLWSIPLVIQSHVPTMLNTPKLQTIKLYRLNLRKLNTFLGTYRVISDPITYTWEISQFPTKLFILVTKFTSLFSLQLNGMVSLDLVSPPALINPKMDLLISLRLWLITLKITLKSKINFSLSIYPKMRDLLILEKSQKLWRTNRILNGLNWFLITKTLGVLDYLISLSNPTLIFNKNKKNLALLCENPKEDTKKDMALTETEMI